MLSMSYLVIFFATSITTRPGVWARKSPSTTCHASQSQHGDEDALIRSLGLDKTTSSDSRRRPFYVELGALDGLQYSNTLRLHSCYNWTGLLIEPDRLNFRSLVTNTPRWRRGFRNVVNEERVEKDILSGGLQMFNGDVGEDISRTVLTTRRADQDQVQQRQSRPLYSVEDTTFKQGHQGLHRPSHKRPDVHLVQAGVCEKPRWITLHSHAPREDGYRAGQISANLAVAEKSFQELWYPAVVGRAGATGSEEQDTDTSTTGDGAGLVLDEADGEGGTAGSPAAAERSTGWRSANSNISSRGGEQQDNIEHCSSCTSTSRSVSGRRKNYVIKGRQAEAGADENSNFLADLLVQEGIPCVPLQGILDLYVRHEKKIEIDFLSLDVEGAELETLRSLDTDKTFIHMALVEVKGLHFMAEEMREQFKEDLRTREEEGREDKTASTEDEADSGSRIQSAVEEYMAEVVLPLFLETGTSSEKHEEQELHLYSSYQEAHKRYGYGASSTHADDGVGTTSAVLSSKDLSIIRWFMTRDYVWIRWSQIPVGLTDLLFIHRKSFYLQRVTRVADQSK
ncbi:unnamed protein product [Amoebophrya sp. A25]|nr:unnamed protein product [Amoebophrya sp. A25]|eukprot:GSA25T00020886001.1